MRQKHWLAAVVLDRHDYRNVCFTSTRMCFECLDSAVSDMAVNMTSLGLSVQVDSAEGDQKYTWQRDTHSLDRPRLVHRRGVQCALVLCDPGP